MDNNETDFKLLIEENSRLNDELQTWKEYTHKILRLVRTFRNDYVIMQTKCIQNIETPASNTVELGFSDFLRGKLHTITEVINDLHIINSIKFIDNTDYDIDVGVEESKDNLNENNE